MTKLRKTRGRGEALTAVEAAVSNKLKAYYDDIVRQDVPQSLLDLLDRLGDDDPNREPQGNRSAGDGIEP